MNFTYIKDRKDYLKFIKRLWDDKCGENYCGGPIEAFDCIEEWLDITGARSPNKGPDDDILENVLGYGPFDTMPKRFPAIAVWHFEKSFDRMGDFAIKIFRVISIGKLREKGELRT